LLADEEHKVTRAWGVWGDKTMYGRKFKGIIRSAFVVDEKARSPTSFPR
jgi:peroxiredoxin Q/BCP